MVMYESGIIQIKGKRNPNGSIQRETFALKFNPILSQFIALSSTISTTALEEIILSIKDDVILNDLLNWDQTCYNYTRAVISATEDDLPQIEDLLSYKNAIELELQSSTKPLHTI